MRALKENTLAFSINALALYFWWQGCYLEKHGVPVCAEEAEDLHLSDPVNVERSRLNKIRSCQTLRRGGN